MLVYLVVVFFVTALLVSIPFFPFWKVWHRLKTRNKDIWDAHGPFDPAGFLTSSAQWDDFLKIINLADRDDVLKARDPELVKWCRLCREVINMFPKSFLGQIALFVLLLYFVGVITSLIL